MRAALAPVDPLRHFVRAPEDLANFVDRREVDVFEWDPLLFWRLRPSLDGVVWDFTLFSTNAQGLRHPRPVGPKEEGAVRVVCLGDSVSFGYRVPTVWAGRGGRSDPDPLPYPLLVDRALSEANPERRVEAIALAVPGYSSHQGRLWLERDIGWLRPDLVIVMFGWNDASQRGAPDSRNMPGQALHVAARRALASSQALLHLSRWLEAGHGAAAPGPRVPRVGVEGFVANHLAIARLAAAHGAHVLVVGPVYRDDRESQEEAERLVALRVALRDAMAEAAVPYLEVPELMESSFPATLRYFGERIHPNHLGHRLLAREVLAAARRHGLLPGLRLPASADRAR